MDFLVYFVAMIKIEAYKSGRLEKGMGYKYFVPEDVNVPWVWSDNELNELLEKASIKLGELNSFGRLVPNIDLFIHLHVTKEAVLSSRIEGTQTNIGEALTPLDEIVPEKRDDWQEVNNYTKALNNAIEQLERLPLSSRLLRQTHAILLNNVRGEHKLPGEFRTSQNWIGGASLADAWFIPPAHQYVNSLMGDLEAFLHNKDLHIPALIKIGIAHYQFETIHPFLDGNGRIGRLMIPLFLVSEGILEKPLLYLSAYFERNKGIYYDNLTAVRDKGNMLHWLKYFLVGIEQTSAQAVNTLRKVLILKEELEKEIHAVFGRKSISAIKMLHHLFKNPIITVKTIEAAIGLSKKAAGDLVSDFASKGWLNEITGQSRNRVFSFERYLIIFD